MRVALFSDTYFPQVSGVATSIKTLKDQLERLGHEVYIFTTTDPNVTESEDQIIRMPSVPFISFTDRRIVVRGMYEAYQIAKDLSIDLIHTHTEFGVGLLGKIVAKKLKIPVVHTYHTMYEDYLHYIAKGKVIRPSHVKFLTKMYTNHIDAVICPSKRVSRKLQSYGVEKAMKVIPTGIDLSRFVREDITQEDNQNLREELGIQSNQIMLLSLSRISYEKNIQAIIQGMPKVIGVYPDIRLVIVGKGPYLDNLKALVSTLRLSENVIFVGEVPNDKVAYYYHAADYFVSCSTSETQGLTYTEAMASRVPIIVEGNEYLDALISHPSLGITFASDEDFADTLIQYIGESIPTDKTILAKKLYEISAECFGKSVQSCYEEVITHYQVRLAEKKSAPPIEKIKVKLRSIRTPLNRS